MASFAGTDVSYYCTVAYYFFFSFVFDVPQPQTRQTPCIVQCAKSQYFVWMNLVPTQSIVGKHDLIRKFLHGIQIACVNCFMVVGIKMGIRRFQYTNKIEIRTC